MKRREFLGLGMQTAAAVTFGNFVVSDTEAITTSRYAPIFPLLDQFVQQHLKDMNAPGLTLTLVDANGVQRVCTYGVDDLDKRTPIKPEQLFHIGSISKTFLGLCLVQLHEEGKLDLNKPIANYLPWLRIDSLTRPITTHDLLTHSAAIPDGDLFPADPSFRHRAVALPGTFFHYSNMGYEALGYLLETIDQRSLAESLRIRILEPLGMKSTESAITLDIVNKVAGSYMPELNDRPYPRQGNLVKAPPISVTTAAGCIASNANDMAAFLTMLINRGKTPNGRIISTSGFELFSTPFMNADELGKDIKYGYGIAADTFDGHTRLHHMGGMVSFVSALEVDLDAGLGVFVSFNSTQGNRPGAVAEYALRLMRASREGRPLPKAPISKPSFYVDAAPDYAGRYVSAEGRVVEIVAKGDRLFLSHKGKQVALEPTKGAENAFAVLHPDFAQFAFYFQRAGNKPEGKFVEIGWGGDRYLSASYQGATEFSVPEAWQEYVGHYRSEDPWIGSVHIVMRAGALWVDGLIKLAPDGNDRFYLGDVKDNPDWISFAEVVNGRTMRMVQSGFDLTRT